MASDEDFLSRWSRRKIESRDGSRVVPEAPAGVGSPDAAPLPASRTNPPAGTSDTAPKARLPSVESLTPESDFAPYMAPEVDGDVRRNALRTLFSDPHFNTMDMLDVYVDDFSKPDPIPQSWMAQLEQVSRLGDRAGRDREEAERRAAAAAEEDKPCGQEGPAEANTRSGESARTDASAPPPSGPDNNAAIPPRNVGE